MCNLTCTYIRAPGPLHVDIQFDSIHKLSLCDRSKTISIETTIPRTNSINNRRHLNEVPTSQTSLSHKQILSISFYTNNSQIYIATRHRMKLTVLLFLYIVKGLCKEKMGKIRNKTGWSSSHTNKTYQPFFGTRPFW